MGTPTLDWRMKGSKGVRISRFQEMVHHSAGMYYARESSEEDLTSWLICFFFFFPHQSASAAHILLAAQSCLLLVSAARTACSPPPHLHSGCLLLLWFEQQLLQSISWGPERVGNESGCWVRGYIMLAAEWRRIWACPRACACTHTHGAPGRVPSYLSVR